MKCFSIFCDNELDLDSPVEFCDDCMGEMAEFYEPNEAEKDQATKIVDKWIEDFA